MRRTLAVVGNCMILRGGIRAESVPLAALREGQRGWNYRWTNPAMNLLGHI